LRPKAALRKSAGTGTATSLNHRFNNVGGTIDVRSGTFLLQGTSGAPYPTHTGGTFNVAAAAFLDLTNAGGTQFFTGNYTGSGEGMVRITGVVNTGSAITIGAGGANFDFPPGLLHWIEGVIDGREDPFTNRGSMIVDVNTTVAFNPWVRLRGTLNNAGTILHLGGGILSISGESGLGNITNLAGGVYEFQGDGLIVWNDAFGPGAAIHNYGTLRKASGAGPTQIILGPTSHFNNVGTLEVAAGALEVEAIVDQVSGDTLTGGTWKVLGSGTIELSVDLFDYSRFTASAATLVLDGPDARFPAIEHLLANTGSLTITNGRVLHVPIGRKVRSFDTGWNNTYALAFDPATGNLFAYVGSLTEIRELDPAGSEVLPRIPFPGVAPLSGDLDVVSEPLVIGGTFVPAGTLLVVNGSAKTLFGIDRDTGAVLASVSLPVPFPSVLGGSYHAARNTMFLVDSATVFEMNPATGALLQSFPVQPAGSPAYSLSHGDLEVDPLTGNLLMVNSGAMAIRELTPTGQFVRDQSIAPLNVGGLSGIAIDEATRHVWVSNTIGEVYELESSFTNSGNVILSPGSTLDVPGTFRQDARGTLTTQVGGNPASGQYGRVIATSGVTLDGTLGVELTNSFGPTIGQQYSIVTFPSATGSFSKFTGLSGGRAPLFAADQLPTSVVVNAVGSAANLAFDAFVAATFPTTATPGQVATVTYDVRNLSSTPATGDWVDSLYLSRDATFDESDILLGRVEHRGGVAGLSTYRETLTAPLPPLAEGTYRIVVLSDSRGLMQDANRANNVGFSTSTISVSVPLLALGRPVSGSIAAGQDRYFRLSAPPGDDVKISADFAAADAAEIFLRYRDPPEQSNFDQASVASSQQQRLLIASPQGGSYYLLLHGRAGTSFTLRADTAGFEIIRLAPQPLRGSNLGRATLDVFGSQFTPQTTLRLLNDSGASRTAESVQFIDSNQLRATFDLTDLPTTEYRIEASDPGAPGPVFALDTFTVTDKPPGIVSLSILSPDRVRVGATIFVDITVVNGNDSPAVAPILEVVATNVASGQERREAMGGDEGSDVLPGVLPPLYEGGVGMVYAPSPKANGVVSTFNLVTINPSTTLINWDSLKETLRPTTIPTDAWDAIWANLRPQLGNTLADLYALLYRNSDQLALLNIHTRNVNRLFKYQLRKANDLPAVPVPAVAVDLSFPAPGLPLVFARDFGASIADRFHVGRLGRGWVDNFERSLENDAAAGVVSIRQGHGTRTFAKDNTGAYYGMPGDFATLTEVAGAFQLREKSGEVVRFRADGRLDYVLDTNGNRITAGYTDSRLTSLTHSNGSAMTLQYNAQGRVSQVTDPAGRIATYGYDGSGEHLLRVTTVAGTTEYTYSSGATGPRAHAITSIGFPTGTHLFFDYDSQGRLARQERDGGAERLTLSYHDIYYRIRDALGNLTDVYFDDLGNTKQTLDALARSTSFGHTLPHSFLTRMIVPDGNTTTFQYDSRGNVVQSLDPLGRQQRSEYEPTYNNLDSWRDALERETGFAYDASGNPLATTYPNGTTDEFGYDSQGNLVRSVSRLGHLIRYTYDTYGLVTRKDLPDGSRVDYVYDTRANLTSATGPMGTTNMEYDSADRMTKISYPGGRFLQFAYDAGGRRIRSTDQSGFSVNHRYDAAGRLAELTDGAAQRMVLYEYDPVGRLVGETRGNRVKTTYEYDAAGQLVHRSATPTRVLMPMEIWPHRLVHPAPELLPMTPKDAL
jgi:YD repeat-containing protein